jgi:hypothetical protein
MEPEEIRMSTQRAFVIQFGPRPPGSPEWFAGKVEHVATGEATRFASPQELLDFLFRLMAPRSEAAATIGPAAAALPPVGMVGPSPPRRGSGPRT